MGQELLELSDEQLALAQAGALLATALAMAANLRTLLQRYLDRGLTGGAGAAAPPPTLHSSCLPSPALGQRGAAAAAGRALRWLPLPSLPACRLAPAEARQPGSAGHP